MSLFWPQALTMTPLKQPGTIQFQTCFKNHISYTVLWFSAWSIPINFRPPHQWQCIGHLLIAFSRHCQMKHWVGYPERVHGTSCQNCCFLAIFPTMLLWGSREPLKQNIPQDGGLQQWREIKHKHFFYPLQFAACMNISFWKLQQRARVFCSFTSSMNRI